MTISPEQAAFTAAALDPNFGNIFLNARAGCGKSTAIVGACRALPSSARVVVLCFEKHAAVHMQERVPYFVQAATMHAYCWDFEKRQLRCAKKPEPRKCARILRELVPNFKDRREWEDDVLRLVSLSKGNPEATIADLADDFGLACPAGVAQQVLDRSNEDKVNLDFDDMLLFALDPLVQFDKLDYVFIDEAQDTNPIQAKVLAKLAAGARVICVGDPSQAIYGFRGASANALAELTERFALRELPLSVTWRCSQAVVREAQRFETTSA